MLHIFYFFSIILVLMNIRIYIDAAIGNTYRYFNFLLFSMLVIGILLTPYHITVELTLYILFGGLYGNFLLLAIKNDISQYGITCFLFLMVTHVTFIIYANNYQMVINYWMRFLN